MSFTRKNGTNGWPNPQANQIEKWAKRYEIECDRHTAQTGTIYLTFSAENGAEITIRCADHADAHCSATFTVDPAIDQRSAVKAWIQANGDDSAAVAATARKREYNSLIKIVGEWAMTQDGEQWYRWASIREINDTDLARIRQQSELGYAD